MAKRLAKIITMGLLIIMSLGLFAGCGGEKMPYNAEILVDFETNLNAEYFEQTFGIKSEPEGLDEWWSGDTDGWWNYDFNGKTLVHKQSLILKSKSEADIAFVDFPTDFDFEKEMVLVCFFAETSQWIKSPTSYTIDNIRIDDSILKFDFKISAQKSSAQGRSNQKSKVIKLDKIDITSVQFELHYII